MGKRAEVAVEKADLVLALVNPPEVAAEYMSRIRNSHASRRVSLTTSTSEKSTSARSPGRYVKGTKTSRLCRFHSATAALTTMVRTACDDQLAGVTSSSCRRVAVRRCLPPVHCAGAVSKACTRVPTCPTPTRTLDR